MQVYRVGLHKNRAWIIRSGYVPLMVQAAIVRSIWLFVSCHTVRGIA
jgi:hypothetical protein